MIGAERLGAAVGGEHGEELRGDRREPGALGDRGQALGLVLGADRRRGEQEAQVGAFGAQALQRRHVRLDGVECVPLARQVEQRPRIARAQIAGSGVVSQGSRLKITSHGEAAQRRRGRPVA